MPSPDGNGEPAPGAGSPSFRMSLDAPPREARGGGLSRFAGADASGTKTSSPLYIKFLI